MTLPILNNLAALRDLLRDPVLAALSAGDSPELAALLLDRAETLGLSGNILPAWLVHRLGDGDNAAARAVRAAGSWGTGLVAALTADLTLLQPLLRGKTSAVTGAAWLDDYRPARPVCDSYDERLATALSTVVSPAEGAAALLEQYKKYGSGDLARYVAFRTDETGALQGIADFSTPGWDDLLGYEKQKAKLLANAAAFVEGRPFNNVLLTGARGTGKSTGVKALAVRFADCGLRLVQLTRDRLDLLAPVMEGLGRVKSSRFIVFFDDLSFDEGENDYKYLKSAIDGSVTPQPDNVMICATSNRRHLLKESWNDRSDELGAEIFREDSTNESISLSDRFGLILHYHTPSQEEYLRIIAAGLKKHGIELSPEEIRVQGVRWEMEHSGRNGRIAEQFVRWYVGNHGQL